MSAHNNNGHGPVFGLSRGSRNCWLLLGLPRNQRISQKNKISNKEVTIYLPVNPLGIAVGGQGEVAGGTKKNPLTWTGLEVPDNTKGGLQIVELQFLQKLSKCMNRIGKFRLSNGKIIR